MIAGAMLFGLFVIGGAAVALIIEVLPARTLRKLLRVLRFTD